MSAPADRITATMAVKMRGMDGEESDQAVRLEYLPSDPFALFLHIIPGEPSGAVWTVSREALWDALRHKVGKGMIGDGDVRVEVTVGRVRVYLYGSNGGWASLNFCRDGLWVYLRAVQAVVPIGQEHRHYDLDAELAKLLPDAAQHGTRTDAEETGDGAPDGSGAHG